MGQGSREFCRELGVKPSHRVLCSVLEVDFSQGPKGFATPWALRHLSNILTSDAFAVSASGSRQTRFITGQWAFGSDSHLWVSGSDSHLEAICARSGSQLENGYEMLCRSLSWTVLTLAPEGFWTFQSCINLDMQAAAFLEGGTFH